MIRLVQGRRKSRSGFTGKASSRLASPLHQADHAIPGTCALSSGNSWAVPERLLSSRTTCAIAQCGSWVKKRCTVRARLTSSHARFSSIR
ncbi:hypothetical protein, partial [Stenotrophomonas daejeonensis]|uniref:hypothetical protein n=1 Tax=Stenotrophomonas daejeonensis TaxID=659018 RepID=UPI001B8041B0